MYSQLEVWICARNFAPDELLDFDVVLCHQIDRVLLLANAVGALALNRVRTFEYERACFEGKLSREAEYLLQFCGGERAGHDSVCVVRGIC